MINVYEIFFQRKELRKVQKVYMSKKILSSVIYVTKNNVIQDRKIYLIKVYFIHSFNVTKHNKNMNIKYVISI